MFLLGLWSFYQAEKKLREVANDDERWGQCWTTVVFHNQVISLKLPENICITLNYLKGVAVKWEKKTNQ